MRTAVQKTRGATRRILVIIENVPYARDHRARQSVEHCQGIIEIAVDDQAVAPRGQPGFPLGALRRCTGWFPSDVSRQRITSAVHPVW